MHIFENNGIPHRETTEASVTSGPGIPLGAGFDEVSSVLSCGEGSVDTLGMKIQHSVLWNYWLPCFSILF